MTYNGNTTELLYNESTTELPYNGNTTELLYNESTTELPYNENTTKLPYNENATELSYNENATELPYNENITQLPSGEMPPNLDTIETLFQVIIGALMCGTVWILISMIVYGNQERLWKNPKKEYFFVAAFIVAALVLLRQVLHLVLFQARSIPAALEHCDLIVDIGYFLLGTVSFATYLFIWKRQREMADARAETQTKCANVVSWIVLVAMILVYVAFLVFNIHPYPSFPGKAGCMYATNRTGEWMDEWIKTGSYLLAAFLVFTQLALLILLIYSDFSISTILGYCTKCECSPMSTKQRVVVSAVVSMLTDILMTGLAKVLRAEGYPVAVVQTMYTIDVFVNSLCLLATFTYFPMILTIALPCGCKDIAG